jgi:hypothetical protein
MLPAERPLALLSPVVLGIALSELFPLFGQIIQREDGRDRTHRHTSPAVNALNRVDIEHLFLSERGLILLGMNTIDRTSINASSVLGADAWLCNYVGHKGEYVS